MAAMRLFVRRLDWDGPVLRWHVRNEGGDDADFRTRRSGPMDWVVEPAQVRREPHPCAFEPRGLEDPGHRCALCDRPTAVYLALYGVLPKVGLTVADRLATRLREQGADGGFVIETAPDRASARRLEQAVSMLYRIPEWRTHQELFPVLAKPRPDSRREASAWRERIASRFESGTWTSVDDVPLDLPLPQVPVRVDAEGRHRGRWLGAWGRYLFYEAAGPFGPSVRALKRSDLEGRWINVAA